LMRSHTIPPVASQVVHVEAGAGAPFPTATRTDAWGRAAPDWYGLAPCGMRRVWGMLRVAEITWSPWLRRRVAVISAGTVDWWRL
jgi:hypothetical protein